MAGHVVLDLMLVVSAKASTASTSTPQPYQSFQICSNSSGGGLSTAALYLLAVYTQGQATCLFSQPLRRLTAVCLHT